MQYIHVQKQGHAGVSGARLFGPTLSWLSGRVLPWLPTSLLSSCGAISNCKSNPTAQDWFSLFLDPLLWSRTEHISSNPAMLCPRFECQQSRALHSNHVLDGKILGGNGWHWHGKPASCAAVLHARAPSPKSMELRFTMLFTRSNSETSKVLSVGGLAPGARRITGRGVTRTLPSRPPLSIRPPTRTYAMKYFWKASPACFFFQSSMWRDHSGQLFLMHILRMLVASHSMRPWSRIVSFWDLDACASISLKHRSDCSFYFQASDVDDFL